MGNKQDIINNLNILAIYYKQERDVLETELMKRQLDPLKI